MLDAARDAWDQTLSIGKEFGYRNGQATVLAPTGTIGFMMDCDTTGIEPDIALIKYKRLVGGGMIKIVNNTITEALQPSSATTTAQVKAIVDYIDTEETIEGAPGLKPEHLPVFDCAFRAANGTRSIHYQGHIRMMAAAQPFISGAISKTVNLPPGRDHRGRAGRVHGVVEAGAEGGRHLPRRLQAHAAAVDQQDRSRAWARRGAVAEAPVSGPPAAVRKKLPDERQSLTHKFSIAGHEGYIHVGLYETGEPGEIFVKMAKEGSTISGLMDSFATAISLALQHGVPLRLLCDKFARTRFEPYGFTENPDIPRRELDHGLPVPLAGVEVRQAGARRSSRRPRARRRRDPARRRGRGRRPEGRGRRSERRRPAHAHATAPTATRTATATTHTGNGNYSFIARTDAPTCPECGSIMIPNGSCHKCVNCGTTSGCS